MAKHSSAQYMCTNCGSEVLRWQGECPVCHEWNTIVENTISESTSTKVSKKNVSVKKLSEIIHAQENAFTFGFPAVERVFGGGLHESQIILLAGEPGIGKSTLLLQIAKNLNKKVVYVSGEESLSQIAKRAERISTPSSLRDTSPFVKGKEIKYPIDSENMNLVDFVSSTELDTVLSLISSKKYELVIIDSIQTMIDGSSAGFAGSVNQVRQCTFKITDIAKRHGISVIIVGQITKEGEIAGPKMMEHLVDTVAYFEGERKSDLRILRSSKNRFGSVGETALFEMGAQGLIEIKDPGSYFIENQQEVSDGVAYSIVSDGSMVYAVEIQALVTQTFFQFPKRLATNYDNNRFQMLLAVLQKKLNLNLSDKDIYVNIAGGIKVTDTAADLAVCAAIISSLKNKKITRDVFIGEVGLSGNIQKTSRHEMKLSQAKNLKFKSVYSMANLKNVVELGGVFK